MTAITMHTYEVLTSELYPRFDEPKIAEPNLPRRSHLASRQDESCVYEISSRIRWAL